MLFAFALPQLRLQPEITKPKKVRLYILAAYNPNAATSQNRFSPSERCLHVRPIPDHSRQLRPVPNCNLCVFKRLWLSTSSAAAPQLRHLSNSKPTCIIRPQPYNTMHMHDPSFACYLLSKEDFFGAQLCILMDTYYVS